MSTIPKTEDARLAEALKFLGHDAREGHSSTLALLELQRIKPDPMTLPQLIEHVERNARRSLAAIDDFMDLARARSQPLRVEEVDLLNLMGEVVADGWAMANRLGVRVKVAPGPEAVIGWADRELLAGALAKLLRDAVSRAPRGADVACAVCEDAADGVIGWVFEITGSPPAAPLDADAESATKPRRARNAAPGLALARVVCARHGGEVHTEVDADRRQTFRMRLPAPRP